LVGTGVVVEVTASNASHSEQPAHFVIEHFFDHAFSINWQESWHLAGGAHWSQAPQSVHEHFCDHSDLCFKQDFLHVGGAGVVVKVEGSGAS
jgi:hypothetical protein